MRRISQLEERQIDAQSTMLRMKRFLHFDDSVLRCADISCLRLDVVASGTSSLVPEDPAAPHKPIYELDVCQSLLCNDQHPSCDPALTWTWTRQHQGRA